VGLAQPVDFGARRSPWWYSPKLPGSWLNNQASGYVSRHPGEGSLVFDHPHLQVTATPLEHLLAMKVLASRSVRDRDDIQLLLNQLRITAPAGVWALVDRYFPTQSSPIGPDS
jgi:hypothetical protein